MIESGDMFQQIYGETKASNTGEKIVDEKKDILRLTDNDIKNFSDANKNKSPFWVSRLREIGKGLIDEGLPILLEKALSGEMNLIDVIKSIQVLSNPLPGNFLKNKGLPFNKGDYRGIDANIIFTAKKDENNRDVMLPVIHPSSKDIPELMLALAERLGVLSDSVKTEEDINALATFGNLVLRGIHPFEDGVGRTAQYFDDFFRLYISRKKNIPITPIKWKGPMDLTPDEAMHRRKNLDEAMIALDLVGDKDRRDYPKGVIAAFESISRTPALQSYTEKLLNGVGKTMFRSIESFRKIEDIKTIPEIVYIANPNTRYLPINIK